jgi:energy-coupling factor transport system permease protein
VSLLPAPLAPVRPAFLTRTTPVARLVAGLAWLVACVLSLDPIVPVRLGVAGVVALVLWSGLPLRRVPARLAPIGFAILSLTVFSILLSSANGDRSLAAVVAAGPLRITGPAISAGLAVGLRVVVIALATLLVFGPSDPTRVADSLVQQWHLPDRFAYGTLAAVRLAPFMASDWTTIGAARRLRGLQPGDPLGRVREVGGRLLVMLVSAIRRAERMALAMDARGFDCGLRRSHYRPVRTGWRDWLTVAGAVAVASAALLAGR